MDQTGAAGGNELAAGEDARIRHGEKWIWVAPIRLPALDWRGNANQAWMGNIESWQLSNLWETVRQRAHAQLRESARTRGNGVLAHLNFSQMFDREREVNGQRLNEYLARHIVIATTVDARRGTPLPHEFKMVVDMRDGGTPLTGTSPHHQSYATNEREGAI